MPDHKINGVRVRPEAVQGLLDELVMFRKYVGTGAANEEGGWFAWFQPEGVFDDEWFDVRVTGCDTEEEAVKRLINWSAVFYLTHHRENIRRMTCRCGHEKQYHALHEKCHECACTLFVA